MKDISTSEKFICPKCNSTKSNLFTSATNFNYSYCSDCNHNFEEVIKQKEIDIILKEILEYGTKNNFIKIELVKINNSFNLVINDNVILKQNFTYELSNTDVYFLENTIFELIQDINENLISKTDIVICA